MSEKIQFYEIPAGRKNSNFVKCLGQCNKKKRRTNRTKWSISTVQSLQTFGGLRITFHSSRKEIWSFDNSSHNVEIYSFGFLKIYPPHLRNCLLSLLQYNRIKFPAFLP